MIAKHRGLVWWASAAFALLAATVWGLTQADLAGFVVVADYVDAPGYRVFVAQPVVWLSENPGVLLVALGGLALTVQLLVYTSKLDHPMRGESAAVGFAVTGGALAAIPTGMIIAWYLLALVIALAFAALVIAGVVVALFVMLDN